MPRFAMKITEEFWAMAAQLNSHEDPSSPFDEEMYIVIDVVSPTEFHAKIMPTDSVLEEFKNDPELHVMW